MRNRYSQSCAIALLLTSLTVSAQTVPGSIIRTATSSAGRAVLDPNTTYNFPNNSSKFSTGFGTDDVTNSELPYKPIPALSQEPFADLRRGPDHSFSDFVPDGGEDGVYAYFDNANLLFRFRMGSVMSGSKGYSVLLDTDARFGATGAAADPNYQPATTGTNGNPGFEIEIVLETNFKIGIYNVDGTSSPVLIKSYTAWQDMSQISIAATNDNGDPDFFMDFYIPFSDLQAAPFNLTTASPIRMSATTVMAPKPAIGGPKSDIYGVNDDNYKNPNDGYEAYIKGQCVFSVTSLQTSTVCPVCTEPPVLNSPISTGTVNITGTWTKSTLSGTQNTATITVYKNGTLLGTLTNVATGSSWALNNVSVTNNDVITARAQGTGESLCHTSNAVTASDCNSANRPTKPVFTCATTNKGMSGNNLSTGWTLNVENITRGTIESISAGAANTGMFTLSGTSPNISWDYSSGCSGGANMLSGSYRVYYTRTSDGCASEPAFFCVTGNGGSALAGTSATPVITSPANGITTAINSISGTGEPNSAVALYVNGSVIQTTTAGSGGSFSFTNLSFLAGQQVYITNVLAGTVATSKCLSATSVSTVTCNSTAPLINVDANGELAAGQPVSGIASQSGDVVRVYLSPSTLVATTTALADGTWSTANAGTTPAAYNAVAGSAYYATAQTGSCGASVSSGFATAFTQTLSSRCGTITGPVSPVATSVSGSLTGSFTTTTVNLYLDGTLIGTTTTNNTAWGPIAVNTADKNTVLYPNGTLTIGIKESGRGEVFCSGSAAAISCSPTPTAPVISPTSSTTTQNQTVTYTISNAVAGTFYALSESGTGESLSNGVWAASNGSLDITTKQLSTTKTYSVLVKATSLTGIDLCSSTPSAASIVVSSTLPVNLINFSGQRQSDAVFLNWETEGEQNFDRFIIERSLDGISFASIGTQAAKGTQGRSTYNYKDEQLPGNNTIYYRLRMVDNNGTYSFSRTLMFGLNNSFVLSVGPNPFTNEISVFLNLSKAQNVKLLLTDVKGTVVKEATFTGQKGNNTFVITGLQHLIKGIYLLKINTAEDVFQYKLLKVH